MTDTKNALAELAEEMKEGLYCLEMDTVPHWVKVYGKAQRIIAELAKVRDTNWSAGYNYPEPNSSSVAISKCREIAEEGGRNAR